MRLPFRADIEGLRAVAILLVVCAHAKVPWLAGGFIGVDVFFVLSGYLITGLLVREFDATGRMDLAAFYARRLQRLLPALLLLVVCTAIAAMVLLAPFEQMPQTRAAGAAAVWTSNFHFALSKLDYFGPAADTNLFLHTWSLGVEEQFYLLWPALMLFLLGAWRWQGGGRDFKRLRRGMVATVVVCLLLSILLTYASPQLGFYTVISRGWQFALGALVFLHFDRNTTSTPRRRFGTMMAGWLGLAGIIAAALYVGHGTPYPGFWALVPSLGTAAVLYAGGTTPASAEASRLLATRSLQAMGRVSYAWYLWHWPTLLLGATLVDPGKPSHLIALVFLSLLLAVASYHLVESPLRRSRTLRSRPRAVLVGGVVLMVVALAGSLGWMQLAGRWAQAPEQIRFHQVRSNVPVIYGMGCDEWFHTARVRACWFGPNDAPHTAVLMGDSIAGQWFPAVSVHFDRPGWRLLVLTKSACPMVDHPIFYPRIGREYTECEQWRNGAIEYLRSIQPDIVLFSSVPTYAYNALEWTEGTARVLDKLGGTGARIGILLPTPVLPFDGPACLARLHWRDRLLDTTGSCVVPANVRNPKEVRTALSEAAKGRRGVEVLDMATAVCPGGQCAAERDGMVVYRDSQHLTAGYVTTLADELETALRTSGLEDQK